MAAMPAAWSRPIRPLPATAARTATAHRSSTPAVIASRTRAATSPSVRRASRADLPARATAIRRQQHRHRRVTGGGNSVLGGFIGALASQNGPGVIMTVQGPDHVTSTGPNSIVGGFAGLTSGTIVASSASGPVSGTSDSYLGGFAGANLGSIAPSSPRRPRPSPAPAAATSSAASSAPISAASIRLVRRRQRRRRRRQRGRRLRRHQRQLRQLRAGGRSRPRASRSGTITNSSATGTASGGPGSTVDPFIALNNPTLRLAPPAFPSIVGGLQRCHLLLRQYRPAAVAAVHALHAASAADAAYAAAVLARIPAVPGGAAGAGDPEPHHHSLSSPRSAPRPWSATSKAPSRRRRSRRRGRRAPEPLPADGRSCPASSAGSWIFRRPPRPA